MARTVKCPGCGITPAWAGKRRQARTLLRVVKDHPRVGGEKFRVCCYDVVPRGSPPRGRGKVADMRKAGLNPRITPAWAGKRSPFSSLPQTYWDHPRVGGEKFFPVCQVIRLLGSPPRGRGKEECHSWETAYQGITPAWAGKSHRPNMDNENMGDHPRVGGEKIPLQWYEFGAPGSPPRGRGKDSGVGPFVSSLSATPARAGKRCRDRLDQ